MGAKIGTETPIETDSIISSRNKLFGFYDETGIPSLLNTSFNLHGEPIVNNINDALHVFENSKLDALWLNRHIIEK